LKIQNAGDLTVPAHHKLMIVGQAGSGKSKLLTTLPGKTFAWVFDPSAESAYKGCEHVDYSSYNIDLMDLTPYSLAKATNEKIKPIGKVAPPKAYLDYANDFNDAWSQGLYDSYENIAMDSFTTFQDVSMDAVMFNNQRFGKVPQQDDYPAAMALAMRNMRSMCSLNKNIYIIFHDVMEQDDATKKMLYVPLIIGKNKARIPNLFNHLLRCTAEQERSSVTKKLETRYKIQTTPDRYVPGIRTAFQGLDPIHDVTIEDFSKPQEYGLGKIISEQK